MFTSSQTVGGATLLTLTAVLLTVFCKLRVNVGATGELQMKGKLIGCYDTMMRSWLATRTEHLSHKLLQDPLIIKSVTHVFVSSA